MNNNKKYFVTKMLSFVSLVIMIGIVSFQWYFENKTLWIILSIIIVSISVIFTVLSEKYDENKNEKQVKNTAIFVTMIYSITLVAYWFLAFFKPNIPALIFIIVLIIILSIIYYIRDIKIKKENSIDKK